MSPCFRHPTRRSHVPGTADGKGVPGRHDEPPEALPAVERDRGRVRIEVGVRGVQRPRVLAVPAPVVHDVRERISRLPRRRDRRAVISKLEHLSPTAETAVDCFGDVDRERLHPSAQRALALRLDEQVQVVVLDRGVDHAEGARRREHPVHRPLHRLEHGMPPQPPDLLPRPQYDVNRMPRLVLRSRAMRGLAPVLALLASRPLAPTAPPTCLELELALPCALLPPHLEKGNKTSV